MMFLNGYTGPVTDMSEVFTGFGNMIKGFFEFLTGFEIPWGDGKYISVFSIIIVIILFNLGIFIIKRVLASGGRRVKSSTPKTNTVNTQGG